jgi:hypothetical protein
MGAWEVLEESSEVAAVHAALLPNGDVVYYSGNTGQDIPAATRIWNPITRRVREPPTVPDTDVFCSGLTPLWDGKILVVGGTKLYPTDTNPFIGSKSAYVLDSEVGWTRVADMVFGRWYPSAIMLADGRVLVVSGASDDGGVTPRVEIYDPLNGWVLLPESANRLLPIYPRLHVLPSGEVACFGNGSDLAFFNPDTQEWRDLGPAGAIPHTHDDVAVLLAPAESRTRIRCWSQRSSTRRAKPGPRTCQWRCRAFTTPLRCSSRMEGCGWQARTAKCAWKSTAQTTSRVGHARSSRMLRQASPMARVFRYTCSKTRISRASRLSASPPSPTVSTWVSAT